MSSEINANAPDGDVSILTNAPNHFLKSLPPTNARMLHPFLKLVNHPSGTRLSRTGQALERIYFPYSGIVSYTVGFSSGEVVEAGMIGRNSVVGATAPLDDNLFTNDATVHVNMTGTTVDVGKFKQLMAESDAFRALLARHEEMALAQAQQIAACNAVHDLDQRLSRWLLQARDLLDSDLLPLTQELLAQILGVHRSSVTLSARRLQQAGLVDYQHGKIRILDVDGLKEVSCECYEALNAHFCSIIGWDPNHH
ncbi:Crp/Fnr family transcriptional regulator [Bradyrhizobium sp.]|uniref:Crp/Fnr family transcriptional regulator n=1 Tax=Bradyrhizobium sp. TaxID=376 RepID=UPI003C3B89B1